MNFVFFFGEFYIALMDVAMFVFFFALLCHCRVPDFSYRLYSRYIRYKMGPSLYTYTVE